MLTRCHVLQDLGGRPLELPKYTRELGFAIIRQAFGLGNLRVRFQTGGDLFFFSFRIKAFRMTPPASSSPSSSFAAKRSVELPKVRSTTDDPESLLPRFGLQSFRPGQRGVVDALAAGADCLCVMPTGGGKSLCYQLPALAREGTTIVVSPLIALMKDQVDTLVSRGIRAKLINSSLSQGQQESVMESMARGSST